MAIIITFHFTNEETRIERLMDLAKFPLAG